MSALSRETDAEFLGQILLSTLVLLEPTQWLPDPAGAEVWLLSDGIYHANFTVVSGNHRSVARIVRQSQWGLSDSEQLVREYAVLGDLIHTQVAPIPLALVQSGPIPFIVESLVPGKYVNYASDMVACAVAIAAVHACAPTRSGGLFDQRPPKSYLLNDSFDRLKNCRLSAINSRSVQLLERVLRRLAEVELPAFELTLIHTDLIQKNLLVDDIKCSIVDWEGARLGRRAWDLAYFLSPVTLSWADPLVTLDPHERTRFLHAYSCEAAVSVDSLRSEIDTFMPFVLLRALSWCVHFASRATDTERLKIRDRLGLFTSPEFIASTFEQAGMSL